MIVICFSLQTAITQEYQDLDGANNSLQSMTNGAVGDQLIRITEIAYQDLISSPAGSDRMNPRSISNALFNQQESIIDGRSLSDFVWVFGQFIDHDLTLVESSNEDASIVVQNGDEHFSPNSLIRMSRSSAAPSTGTSILNPRQHLNATTAFIDGSAIYGTNKSTTDWLRSFQGGRLKVSKDNLLPWNTITSEFNGRRDVDAPHMADATGSGTKLFVAGDERANENPLLISMHTLFVREHNRLADSFASDNPSLTDEQTFQMARRHVTAYLQNIVYNEWLPSMGVILPEYHGYNESMSPGIFNVFSSAAFRLGHTLINSNIIRMSPVGDEIPRGNMTLEDGFFNPGAVLLAGGVDPYFQGMASQVQQAMDCKIVDDVRNISLGGPEAGGLDLAAINIQRGRERGLPDYNTVRENLGLPLVKTFYDITNDQDEARELEAIYGSVDNIDPWVGMLAEYHMPDALFGETIMMIMKLQFQLVRDADRFYYENDPIFSSEEVEYISRTSFREIVMRNTQIKLMQPNIFEAMPYESIPNGPELDRIQLISEVYPNPTVDNVVLKVFSNYDADINITFFDNSGRAVIQDVKTIHEGTNFISYNVASTLSKGVYNILIEEGNFYGVSKLIVD